MAFFADLTPHTYSPSLGLDILNIGWLDEGHSFRVGPTSEQFRGVLLELCQHSILLHRGFHVCCYCRGQSGNGQIRVLSARGVWYAAPTLVHHYVTAHEYRPPDDFVNAVLAPVAVGADYGWFPELGHAAKDNSDGERYGLSIHR